MEDEDTIDTMDTLDMSDPDAGDVDPADPIDTVKENALDPLELDVATLATIHRTIRRRERVRPAARL